VPQRVELPEHGLVRDVPPLGLLDDGLGSQQQGAQPFQTLSRASGLLSVVPVNEEGYGFANNIAKNRRDDHLHGESLMEGKKMLCFAVWFLLGGFTNLQ